MAVAGGIYQLVTLQDAAQASADGETLTCSDGIEGSYAAVAFQVDGVFVATVTFEATVDGTNWKALEVVDVGDSATIGTTTTVTGIYRATVLGLLQVRARVTYTSGSVTVTALAVA